MTEHNLDENKLITQRREKLHALREQGVAYPNDFRRNALAGELHHAYENKSKEDLDSLAVKVSVAGRMMAKRIMGKTSFTHVQDMTGRIQLFIQQNNLSEEEYHTFKTCDIGDIIACEGVIFKTKTGELSVKAERIVLLTKSLRPLPEKFHGLTDTEQRYRQRYVDLIMNEDVRRVFKTRTHILQYIRHFFDQRGFLEVETPMMQPIPGGATARPFTTYHNALDMPLYLRVAPELYLKRLVVGGFEKVYEINRNFRNEGISTQHNPEFTMLEFYQAYADYQDFMDLTEVLFRGVAEDVVGSAEVCYQGVSYNLAKPFVRMTLRESILHYNSTIDANVLDNIESAREIAEFLHIPLKASYGLGKIQLEIFEKTVEENLIQPTFITQYPAEVSPLSRRNDQNPFVTDRFEFFIAGRELANGFSELNDPEDQAERFRKQAEDKNAGDEEAMHFDADYVRALEHGLPPTAGEGIGIDRLVMFFTDSASIRDVLLFPHLRPE